MVCLEGRLGDMSGVSSHFTLVSCFFVVYPCVYVIFVWKLFIPVVMSV